jgi:hypothetical protein
VLRGPTYRIPVVGGQSTEKLVAAGAYDYAHSCVISENFPVRSWPAPVERHIVLIGFEDEVTSEEVITAAAAKGLERPTYEDALYFGIHHPDVQRERPLVFLHEPWVGYFGRRDVLCLWFNAGRRELGLEDFDGGWGPWVRFGFVE